MNLGQNTQELLEREPNTLDRVAEMSRQVLWRLIGSVMADDQAARNESEAYLAVILTVRSFMQCELQALANLDGWKKRIVSQLISECPELEPGSENAELPVITIDPLRLFHANAGLVLGETGCLNNEAAIAAVDSWLQRVMQDGGTYQPRRMTLPITML